MGDMAQDAENDELVNGARSRADQARGRTMIFPVVGMTFLPGYPANLTRLDAAIRQVDADRQGTTLHGLNEGPAVVLKRNPANKFDANAIEVHVPAVATGTDPKAGMIGHVPASLAAKWAPLMDKGEMPRAWVDGVRKAKGHEDRPGIDVKTVWPAKGAPSATPPSVELTDEELADHVRRARYDRDDSVTLADAQAAGFTTVESARSAFEAWEGEARARGSW